MSERTPFAGLEVLAPTDSFSADGFRFQSINPGLIDHMLRIGALTHKHDAKAALATPAVVPTLTQAPTGGSIPGDLTIYSVFTLVDVDGGETLASAPAEIVTPPKYPDPQGVPTAVVSYEAGSLLANNFSYGVTITDGVGGETTLSPAASVLVEPGFATAEVTLAGLA